jgi:hypothetical protein
VKAWVAAVGAKTAYIAPGSPWENGFIESLNVRLRDELGRFYQWPFGADVSRLTRP